MVNGSLALLLFIGLELPLGNRVAAPIGDEVLQNGEIYRMFVCPSIRPPNWASQPGLRPRQLGLRPEAQKERYEKTEMEKQKTNRKRTRNRNRKRMEESQNNERRRNRLGRKRKKRVQKINWWVCPIHRAHGQKLKENLPAISQRKKQWIHKRSKSQGCFHLSMGIVWIL